MLHFSAVSARVHKHAAAKCSRNAMGKFQPGQRVVFGKDSRFRHAFACKNFHPCLIQKTDACQCVLQADDDRLQSLVWGQHICPGT